MEIKNLDDEDEILIKITSGTLQFVHIHFRSSTGIWYDAYHGRETKFKVKDILKGDRNSYTHLVFNVNAQHERYLGTVCRAEVWQIPASESSVPIQQQVVATSNPETSSDLDGKYVFESRSDGKSLVNFHYILIEADGLFIEKYQPKNSGDYIGGGRGKWKQNDNEIIFNYDDGIVENYTIKTGSRIERKTDSGIVFTFKKEL